MSEETKEANAGITCDKCDATVEEVCGGGYCRACHKSLTFEDCVDGSWARRQREAGALESRQAGRTP